MQTKTERLSWHSQYFFGRESSASQLKYCFSVLLISWLGPEKPGTRQPLSSLPLAYHHLLVCLFSPFSLFHALAFKPFISPPFIPIFSVHCICRPRSRAIVSHFTIQLTDEKASAEPSQITETQLFTVDGRFFY